MGKRRVFLGKINRLINVHDLTLRLFFEPE
jgi:hypothetical protein